VSEKIAAAEKLAHVTRTQHFNVARFEDLNDRISLLNYPHFFEDGFPTLQECGLDVVEALMQKRPDARAIILTGYGNIATAVKAAKLGAVDYLPKPVDADDIVSALQAPLGGKAQAPQRPVSPANVRLQHIQQVHEASGRNISETARRLNMHRRTLQRILSRRAG
jgi:two-component system, response regulator RegA